MSEPHLAVNQWWRERATGQMMRVASFGEKNVQLDIMPKLLAPRRMTREKFFREWEYAEMRPAP